MSKLSKMVTLKESLILAMCKNINRLIRKTWCTTKDPTMLKKHIEIFIYYFNHIYLKDVRT